MVKIENGLLQNNSGKSILACSACWFAMKNSG